MKFFALRQRRKFINEARARRHAEDDLLSAAQKEQWDLALAALQKAPAGTAEYASSVAHWKKICPDYHWVRNLLDLLVVVGAVAFGIRGLYLQPFKIPTSSMQPTLYGIHFRVDTPLGKTAPGFLNYALYSVRRAHAQTVSGGQIDPESLFHTGFWSDRTGFNLGSETLTLPGDPRKVIEYANLDPEKFYAPQEILADGFLSLGDHLFVERFSIYLKPPRRGDVMVFSTEGLVAEGRTLSEVSGFYYVKRLVGLPGDTLKLIDNTLFVKPRGAEKFQPIYELDPRFKKLYSGQGGYQGHLSEMGDAAYTRGAEFTLAPDCYFMLGDNSTFSLDSRFFGPVPRRNLIGRAWLVFWPFTRRWGWVDRVTPLPVPTGVPRNGTFPTMYLQ